MDRKQRFVAALFAFAELLDKKSRSGKERKMRMKKEVKVMLSAVAVMAVGSGICYAVKHGRKKKMGDMEVDPVLNEEGMTEEKVRENLLRLFRLYEDSEFDDFVQFVQDTESDPREYVADNYSRQLFPYIKKNMKDVMILEGDDGTGNEPFSMTDELFCYPACMIGCGINELFSDSFALCREGEIWMLENGEFASVHCVSLGNGDGRISYRFLDTYIKKTEDIPICFDDLEGGFTQIIEAEKEGRKPELP